MSILLFLSFYISTSEAKSEVWKTLKSTHFEIIYDADQRQLAEHYLSIAEKVHTELKEDFSESPETTYLILQDQTDLSNGAATVFPSPSIYLYPITPEKTDSISNFSSWSYLLLKHEYTHILNMYPSNGAAKVLYYIFGAYMRPNMFLPTWYKEGIAVERESTNPRFGRLNSSFFQGWRRSLIFDNTYYLDRVDNINSFEVPRFPYGQRPYFYGALLWEHLTKNYDTKTIDLLNQHYSRRFPGWIEQPIEDITAKEYSEHFLEMQNNLRKKAIEETKSVAEPDSKELQLQGYFPHHLQIVEKQGLYITKNLKGLSELRLFQFSDPKQPLNSITKDKLIAESYKITQAQFLENSILFDKVKTFDRKNSFSDLFLYDLKHKKTEQLTKGERARFPVQYKNDIYYLRNKDAYHYLSKTNQTTNEKTNLYKTQIEESLYYLKNIQGNLYFVLKQINGVHRIMKYSLETGEIQNLWQTNNNINYLGACGEDICFSHDTSGINNLYKANTSFKKISNLTDTKTYVHDGFIYNDQLIFNKLSSNGLKYHQRPLQKLRSLPQQKIQLEEFQKPIINIEEEGDYYSTSHLLPKYWFPYYSYDANGSYLQINTGASDPLTHQAYSLSLSYYSATEKWDHTLSYINTYWSTIWFAQSYQQFDYIEAIDDSIKKTKYNLGMQDYIYGLSNDWTWGLQAIYEGTSLASTHENEAGGYKINITYSDIDNRKVGYLEPEKGNYLDISYSEYINQEDDWYEFSISELKYKNYFSKWLANKHSLRTTLLARYSEGDSRPLSLGSISIGGPLDVKSDSLFYSLKGYPSSNFIAQSAYNLKFNYSFPLSDVYSGNNTLPYFIKQIYMNFLYEGLMFDGAYYNHRQNLTLERHQTLFSSTGVEFKISTDLLHLLPINFVFGVYSGNKEQAGADTTFALNLEVPSL